MKVLGCKDVGVECDFVAKGKTVDDVLKKTAAHAKTHHGIKRLTKDYLDSWKKRVHNE